MVRKGEGFQHLNTIRLRNKEGKRSTLWNHVFAVFTCPVSVASAFHDDGVVAKAKFEVEQGSRQMKSDASTGLPHQRDAGHVYLASSYSSSVICVLSAFFLILHRESFTDMIPQHGLFDCVSKNPLEFSRTPGTLAGGGGSPRRRLLSSQGLSGPEYVPHGASRTPRIGVGLCSSQRSVDRAEYTLTLPASLSTPRPALKIS